MLADVDKTLQDFWKNLTSNGLDDEVNIMIFSDHGMTNITKFVSNTDTIDYSDIKVMFSTVTFLCIWPEEGKLNKVSVHIHKVSCKLSLVPEAFRSASVLVLRKVSRTRMHVNCTNTPTTVISFTVLQLDTGTFKISSITFI